MARILIVLVMVVVFTPLVHAQSETSPVPTPSPYLGRSETTLERIRRQDRDHERIAQDAYNKLHGQGAYADSRYTPEWRAKMVALYRKPKEKDLEAISPGQKHVQKYSNFLRAKNTGITKLVPFSGCGEAGKVVDVSEPCQKYAFPGHGSSYSFRAGAYRIRQLADITLYKNSLITRGVMAGVIYVELGNVPLENVTLKTKGMPFLADYRPEETPEDAVVASRRFAKGVDKDGFYYGRGVYVTPNSTFAMRSIAYRGKFFRREEGVEYNELEFDRRRDIIVAVRILEVEKDGAITIAWKILRDQKSPKLEIKSK